MLSKPNIGKGRTFDRHMLGQNRRYSAQDGVKYLSWITLSTALLYSSLMAYLVLVKDWSLLNAGLAMFGLGLAVTTTIV